MWKQKQLTWEQITKEFNAINGTTRSSKNIKCKYENLKKTAKKKFAVEKRNVYKTGGGTDQPVNITPTDEKIKEIIGISLEGLVNSCDSDSLIFEVVDDREKENVVEPVFDNWLGWSPAQLKVPKSTPLTLDINETGNNPKPISFEESENISAMSDSKKTSSENISVMNDSKKTSSENIPVIIESKKTSNVRKTLGTKSKNKLTEDCRTKINVLSEAKLELVHLQIEALRQEINCKKVEHVQKIDNNQVEHELKMEQLKLQIQLLKKQLLN